RRLRALMEANPFRFHVEQYDRLLDDNRALLAGILSCDKEGLAFCRNATEGVSAAATAIPLSAGDEIVTTQHEYASFLPMWERLCATTEARLRVVDLPSDDHARWAETVLTHVTPRTKVLFLSQITSSTALVLPTQVILDALRDADIVTILDAAHAPGQIPIDLERLLPDVYVGNLHKWAMHPRGAAFIYASERVRDALAPTLHSWYYTAEEFDQRFSWLGTSDPTSWFVTRAAQEFHALAHDLGWDFQATSLSTQAERRLREIPGMSSLSTEASRAPYFFAMRCATWDEPELTQHLRSSGLWPWTGTWHGHTVLRVSTSYYTTQGDIDRLLEVMARSERH
ncbi:MAG: aminotransferase class V-fold PLP-dependent enzyme, partial [Mycobacteriales bacterium]